MINASWMWLTKINGAPALLARTSSPPPPALSSRSLVIPELKGKFDGMAFRVPVVTVSVVDLVAELNRDTTIAEINEALSVAANGSGWWKVLNFTMEPLVSSDFIPASSTVDGLSTQVIGGNLVKVVTWYDNEWGYSSRLADLTKFVADQL